MKFGLASATAPSSIGLNPFAGVMHQTGNPFKVVGSTNEYAPAPPLGADTDAILSDLLGYSSDQIASLRQSGAI